MPFVEGDRNGAPGDADKQIEQLEENIKGYWGTNAEKSLSTATDILSGIDKYTEEQKLEAQKYFKDNAPIGVKDNFGNAIAVDYEIVTKIQIEDKQIAISTERWGGGIELEG